MKKIKLPLVIFIILAFLIAFDLSAQDLGITFGFNSSARTSTGGTYNHSLFRPTGQDSDWWNEMAEEISYSGVDYIAPVTRGYSPNHPNTDAGDPRKLPLLCAAMDHRPLDNTFKIAIFDDNAASWAANRNLDLGFGYGYNPPFDCGDTANYKYIWDYDLKVAIQNIPDEKRYKIKNRMVIIFWSVNPPFCTNQGNGHIKAIVLYIRKQCQAAFGFNPYLVADGSWVSQDPSCNDSAVIDAVQNWFAAPVNSFTLYNFFGTKVGALCPGFQYSGSNVFMDPNHGNLLVNNLTATVRAGARFTLGEGFTDEEEACAWWRSNDTVYYDYPNQRLNITRRFTARAFAGTHKIEAEACDSFSGAAGAGSGLYRSGNLNIVRCNDANGGWQVTGTQAGLWLQWRELPLPAATKFTIEYASAAASSVRFSVDGAPLAAVSLPSTGGAWSAVDAGTCSFGSDALHTVRLSVVSGSPDLNYFLIKDMSLPAAAPVRERNPAVQYTGAGRMVFFAKGAVSFLNVNPENEGIYRVELFDLSGRRVLVYDCTVTPATRVLRLPNAGAGARICRIIKIE
ncbi:MAG TPA: DUF5010 domain-containing protein [Chitinivibrionales bacterium]|nr:DUF5010 domain-containing protein [Chitinivibrionales bacterium]